MCCNRTHQQVVQLQLHVSAFAYWYADSSSVWLARLLASRIDLHTPWPLQTLVLADGHFTDGPTEGWWGMV